MTNAIFAATVKWGFSGGHGFGDRSKIRNLYSTIKIPQTVAAQWLYPVAFRDSLDWKDYDAGTIFDRVTTRVAPGSIVLFHNAALHTPEALPNIVEHLIHEGYTIVPISELILDGDYMMDHTGRQCPCEAE